MFIKELKIDQDGYAIYLLLELFNTCIDELGREALKRIVPIVDIFDEVSFDKAVFTRLNEINFVRTECLKFYSKLCLLDVSIVYERRNHLVSLLNIIGDLCHNEIERNQDDFVDANESEDDFEDVLFYAFALIE